MTIQTTSLTRELSITCAFTALVCVATVGFTVYVPSTKGYFNIGETMIYTAALLFGPSVGAFAGGVGSMFADLLLGYYYYAPATLLIKALEGFTVGFLSKKGKNFAKSSSENKWRGFTVGSGVIIGTLVSLIGSMCYSGYVELYSSIISAENPASTFFIPTEFWPILGVLAAVLISAVAFTSQPEFGLTIVSCICGGILMVLGYFLYEQLFLGVFALAEVPINIGQMTVGMVVAAPIVKIVRRVLPQLKG